MTSISVCYVLRAQLGLLYFFHENKFTPICYTTKNLFDHVMGYAKKNLSFFFSARQRNMPKRSRIIIPFFWTPFRYSTTNQAILVSSPTRSEPFRFLFVVHLKDKTSSIHCRDRLSSCNIYVVQQDIQCGLKE